MINAKGILFRVTAVILECLAAFLIAEFALRAISPQPTGPIQLVYDRELGAIHVPLQNGRRVLPEVYDYTYHNNSSGLRGQKEYTGPKKAGFRILFLGDSVTYGVGVNDNQTFCQLIERQLSLPDYPVEVINAGCMGKGTDYALRFFQTRGINLSPDLVALGFFPNDFKDNARNDYYRVAKDGSLLPKLPSGSFYKKKIFLPYIKLYDWLISWSHLANLFKQAALKVLFRREISLAGKNKSELVADEGERQVTRIYIAALEKAAEDADSRIIIFYSRIRKKSARIGKNTKFQPPKRQSLIY